MTLKWRITQIQIGLLYILTNTYNMRGRLKMKHLNKKYIISISFVNLSFTLSNILAALYTEYLSPSWYDILGCASYQDFVDTELLVTRKQLDQWFLVVRWSHHVERLMFSIIAVSQICYTCRSYTIVFLPSLWIITEYDWSNDF